MDERLAPGGYPSSVEAFPELISRKRTVCFEGPPDDLDTTIAGVDRDPLLSQPAGVAGDDRRSGQRV
jgi:hypothetical protein